MKVPRVSLYIRVSRTGREAVYVEPAWNKNRTLRAGYALINGVQEYAPGGVYYLRYAQGGKRVREAVGRDPDLALTALRNREHDLRSRALGLALPDAGANSTFPQTGSCEMTVRDAVAVYLAEVRSLRAAKTITGCEHMLGEFTQHLGSRSIAHLTRADLLSHMVRLRARGLGDRTVFNHMARINTLLKANNVSGLLKRSDWPRYDEKAVSAYHPEQLAALFRACNVEGRLLYRFFVFTGFREQEVMHVTWGDVNFQDKVISVRSKPQYGFRPKDKEERSVPVPDSLIDALAARKKTSRSMLIFPGNSGRPDGHFLRKLQRIAHRAGLNCGECITRSGKSCTDDSVCHRWGLHEFRRTFATSHAEAGVAPTTIQRWLGHSDLATTLRYLAVADLRSDRTRSQVNTSFTSLEAGIAA